MFLILFIIAICIIPIAIGAFGAIATIFTKGAGRKEKIIAIFTLVIVLIYTIIMIAEID